MNQIIKSLNPPLANYSNNQIYVVPSGTNPYNSPTSTGVTTADKYIAGYRGVGAGCGVAAGTWLRNPFNTTTTTGVVNENNAAGVPTAGTFANANDNLGTGYYFIMDYRIVPGLPARFLAGHPRRATNLRSPSGAAVLADVANLPILGAASTWGASGNGTQSAMPGAYSMYVKYVVAEDQQEDNPNFSIKN